MCCTGRSRPGGSWVGRPTSGGFSKERALTRGVHRRCRLRRPSSSPAALAAGGDRDRHLERRGLRARRSRSARRPSPAGRLTRARRGRARFRRAMKNDRYAQKGWGPDGARARLRRRRRWNRDSRRLGRAWRRSRRYEESSRRASRPERLLEIVWLYERLVERLYVVSAYGSLWFAEDTQDTEALAYRNRVDHELTGDAEPGALLRPVVGRGSRTRRRRGLLPAGRQGARRAGTSLEEMRRTRPYVLDERLEQVINLKDADGVSALLTVVLDAHQSPSSSTSRRTARRRGCRGRS